MEPLRRLPPLPQEIAETLARGGSVLTGNQRAARTLRMAFDGRCRTNGMTTWQPPNIFAWDTWTARLWHELLLAGNAGRLLLNRTQELQIWRSVIGSDSRHDSLASVDSLATMAADAWQRLCAYRGQSRLKNLGVSEDTRTFQRWAQTFIQRCNSDLYLPKSELENFLIRVPRPKPEGEILLVGFDSMSPAQSALIEAIRQAGTNVVDTPTLLPGPNLFLAATETLEDELTVTALSIRAALQGDPGARIAFIHPEIASERSEIDRVFRRILAPELDSIAAGPVEGPYEFSLGEPLAQSPMIATALQLLRWNTGPLPMQEVGRLLLSPWFTPARERDLRAEFDSTELRRSHLLRPELNLTTLIRMTEGSQRYKNRLGDLTAQLHALHRTAERLIPESSRQKPSADWADHIRELLHACGWASAARESSLDFQTRRKWEAALDELATLDFEGTRPTFAEALGHLECILDRTLFAPESRDAPVQIMSPQEAAGSRFDAVYFVRCSYLAWPTPPGTDPLLGWRLQRDLGVPGSDPAGDMAHARAVTERIAASAPTVVFSYARQTTDAHQRPSPLLAGLALQATAASQPVAKLEAIALEEIEDPGDIPLAGSKVRGGSTVLKNQAACGFRAFAEARLASKPLDTIEPGMDARERGSVVHATMAALWSDLRTQAKLRALTSEERHAALDRAITAALKRASQEPVSTWGSSYIDIQRERLHRLIRPWLEEELTRSAFVVKSTEERFDEIAFGPLTLDIRVDRIDTLLDPEGAAAGEVLLDYKTGDAHPKDWLDQRPDDPQLPLYAVLSAAESLAAVAFVRLRPGKEVGLRGFASDEGILTKRIEHNFTSLEAQIADWRSVLTALAEDFAAGDARVRPKTYPRTCAYCVQRILCRVDPTLFEVDAEDFDGPQANESESTHG